MEHIKLNTYNKELHPNINKYGLSPTVVVVYNKMIK